MVTRRGIRRRGFVLRQLDQRLAESHRADGLIKLAAHHDPRARVLVSSLMNSSSRSTVLALVTLYASTVMSGMWAMLVPAIPVLSSAFQISAGAAAQIITALSFGRFVGMPTSGVILDRLGTRASLIAVSGARLRCRGPRGDHPWVGLCLCPSFGSVSGTARGCHARGSGRSDSCPNQQAACLAVSLHQ